jgi:GH35 family endo-1,4-beta-xylanase
MNRRTFLRSTAGATPLVLAKPGLLLAAQEDGDTELLAQAEAGIAKHRQGDGVILVRGSDGRAIPGATVKVEQLRHDFRFGCNCFGWGRNALPQHEQDYRRRFADLLNFATLGFYWSSYERERGRPNYEYTDQVAAWCQEQQIACKGHPLVWDYTPDPQWLPHDFAEIRALSDGRVREIVSRYRQRIEIWDVVNEPTHLGRTKTRMSEWAMSLGAGPYVAEHLKIAREANPAATLLVNDYRTDPPFYSLLDGLREGGKLLFDAIGIQSHMHHGVWPLRQIRDVCDRYAGLGLPVHFTETTVVSGPHVEGEKWKPTTPDLEAKQADYVPRFYTMLFGHPAAQALTWWDFSDQGAWQGAAAGLVRADMSPKPVYEQLHALIKGKWWTRREGTTNAEGEFALRAFHGKHRVTVRVTGGRTASRDIDWKPGQPNRIPIVV